MGPPHGRVIRFLYLHVALIAICTSTTGALLLQSREDEAGSSQETEELNLAQFDANDLVGCEDMQNKSAQRYIIMGPMDSGTNLLHAMMQQTWPSDVCHDRGLIWKHAGIGAMSISMYLLQTIGAAKMRNMIVLHTMRSPIALMASWRKAPYTLKPCVNRDLSAWHKPCSVPMGTQPDSGGHQNNPLKVYSSTMAVYNQYLAQYDEFSHQRGLGFKAVVPVPYEDLLLTPRGTMQNIAKYFDGLPRSDDASYIVPDAAKRHGSALGRSQALEKLHSRSYLQDFPQDMLGSICAHLDQNLLADWQEGTWLDPSSRVSYAFDCQQVKNASATSAST